MGRTTNGGSDEATRTARDDAGGGGRGGPGRGRRRSRRRRPAAGASGSSTRPTSACSEHHAGEDLADQLKFAADQGFTAWEDNGMPGRPVDVQERVAREMARLGMTMGVFVAMGDFDNVTFASAKPEARADILAKGKAAVEVAKRVNAKWMTVVPGRYDQRLEWDYQTAHVDRQPEAPVRGLRAGTAWSWSSSRSTRGRTTPGSSSRRSPRPSRSAARWAAPRARSSSTCTTSRSRRGTSSRTSTARGARSPTSSRATTRAARSPPRAR
jgi:hypothetical protein